MFARIGALCYMDSGFRRNDDGESGSDDGERGRDEGVGSTKFGMLRLAFGELGARSNACEVPSLPEWIGTAESNNGDQEV